MHFPRIKITLSGVPGGLLMAVLIFVSILYLLRPISDFDFFWHLKTGEMIWKEKGLLTADPFSLTTSTTLTSRQHFILTSYWASQILYYLIHEAGGMNGIALFRCVIAGLIVSMLFSLRKGDRNVSLGLGIICLVIFFELYPLERPQVFSFLFFALLLHLIDKIRAVHGEVQPEENTWSVPGYPMHVLLLCLLMLVWSNMHGGHLIGQAVIIACLVSEGIKFGHRCLGPVGKRAYLRLVAAGIAGIVFSLINPNTYHAFGELMSMPAYMKVYNIEFQSTLEVFRRYDNYVIALFWLVMLLTLTGLLLHIRQTDITKVMLITATGYFAFIQMRYIAFFLVAALPVAAKNLSLRRFQPLVSAGVVIMAMTAVLYFTQDELPALRNFSSLRNVTSWNWINEYSLPIKAVDFIQASDLRGNMFNRQSWGGYLMWRLGPEKKVFFDGRQLDENMYAQATLVEFGYAESVAGVPFWKSTLDAYGVKFIIVPFFQPHGAVLPLVRSLLKDQDWRPVFFHMNSVIFVKDSPENYHLLTRHSIPRDIFVDDLINVCNGLIRDYPWIIYPYIAKGDLYAIKEMRKEARDMYEEVLRRAPHNPTARERIQALPPS